MTPEEAKQWGEDEARLTIEDYKNDVEDLGEDEAIAILLRRRNHASTFIDVPAAWKAYLKQLSDVSNGLPLKARIAIVHNDFP